MKQIILGMLMLASTQAFAVSDGVYNCEISPKGTDKAKVQLSFEIEQGDVTCKEDDGDTCMRWFDYGPADQEKFWLDGLYDGGYGYLDNGNWEVTADSDGCDIGKLVLYKNSGFTKGFITSEFRCSGPGTLKYAGTVSCKIQK